MTTRRRRLDLELVRRSLAPSRTAAGELIEAGRVLVNGAPTERASRLVDPADAVTVLGPPARFVGRGGGNGRECVCASISVCVRAHV